MARIILLKFTIIKSFYMLPANNSADYSIEEIAKGSEDLGDFKPVDLFANTYCQQWPTDFQHHQIHLQKKQQNSRLII